LGLSQHADPTVLCCFQQTTHQEAVASLQSELQQAATASEVVKQQLSEHDGTIQQQLQQLADLTAAVEDLQNQLGECRTFTFPGMLNTAGVLDESVTLTEELASTGPG
jgi:septal ring factor EnvC (AmiA/AmiB activator)